MNSLASDATAEAEAVGRQATAAMVRVMGLSPFLRDEASLLSFYKIIISITHYFGFYMRMKTSVSVNLTRREAKAMPDAARA
ncbi:hypothetical protein OHD62_32320 [Mesorhizobium sp. YC-39]|uniref:hypothetical protein n=1 Tax=unclassified Mesorhizobium TaxID=325217 RepID=UPI0021E71F2B|nr:MULTISPECIES: hypothetical protein [unclassified Mesorhizobium]MCV3211242.1 hypothetical protein [Mesorhizobium sp. YC-2]MCV3233070.1 hypothetical protein [Mesorhizobium sp. YC-39]